MVIQKLYFLDNIYFTLKLELSLGLFKYIIANIASTFVLIGLMFKLLKSKYFDRM